MSKKVFAALTRKGYLSSPEFMARFRVRRAGIERVELEEVSEFALLYREGAYAAEGVTLAEGVE